MWLVEDISHVENKFTSRSGKWDPGIVAHPSHSGHQMLEILPSSRWLRSTWWVKACELLIPQHMYDDAMLLLAVTKMSHERHVWRSTWLTYESYHTRFLHTFTFSRYVSQIWWFFIYLFLVEHVSRFSYMFPLFHKLFKNTLHVVLFSCFHFFHVILFSRSIFHTVLFSRINLTYGGSCTISVFPPNPPFNFHINLLSCLKSLWFYSLSFGKKKKKL